MADWQLLLPPKQSAPAVQAGATRKTALAAYAAIVPNFPVARAVLTQALYHPAPLFAALDGVDLTPTVSADVVTVLLAAVYQWPMRNVRVLRQAGRFVLVRYDQWQVMDPEIIITLAEGQAAEKFNSAMLQHQQVRQFPRDSAGDWYRRVMDSVRAAVSPLASLHPDAVEAAFVLRWMLLNAAKGRTV